EISMYTITTMLTPKQRLSNSVTLRYMTTFITCLTSITRLYKLYPNTFPKRLEKQERLQLEEAPGANLLTKWFSLICFLGLLVSNVGQILKNQYVSILQSGCNLFRNAMICISTKTVLLASYFSKVSFSRMSFTLKNAS